MGQLRLSAVIPLSTVMTNRRRGKGAWPYCCTDLRSEDFRASKINCFKLPSLAVLWNQYAIHEFEAPVDSSRGLL